MLRNLLKISISVGVSFAVVALLLRLVSTGLSDAERPSVVAALQNTSASLLLIVACVFLLGILIRAIRYRLLLRLCGEENVPNLTQMYLVTAVRNMFVDMFPGRVGELVYIALLNRGYKVKVENGASSLAIAIAFDFIGLLLVATSVGMLQLGAGELTGWALSGIILALILSLIAISGLFVILPAFNRYMQLKFKQRYEAENLLGKAFRFVAKLSDSVTRVRDSGGALKVVVLSIIIRLLKYSGFYLLFKAVATPSFESLAVLSDATIVGALIGGEIGASLPLPTFMSFGSYEAGTALVFQLLGVADQAAALVTMLCVHIWSQALEYLLGGVLLAVFFLVNRGGRQSQLALEDAGLTIKARFAAFVSFIVAGAALMAGVGFLGYQVWAAGKLGALNAPEAGVENTAGKEDLALQLNNLDGFVVFSSNRDGNHDIFKLELADQSLTKLTTHAHTETYPRISPDGKRLLFARAHQPWVSQRNTVAWDVVLLDLQSGVEQVVSERSTSPAWVDNNRISFIQDTVRFQTLDLVSNQLSTVYETGINNQMPKGSGIYNPKINPLTGQVVFTAKQSHIGSNTGFWGTAIDTNGKHRAVLDGCELTWSSDGRALFQITRGGREQGLRIVQLNQDDLSPTTLIDLEGEFSHEYWPKQSFNGEYLVFGASRGVEDHEHDTKDYEIFLWKMGSDYSKATRLTFHTGNDNWPDVFIR